MKFFSLILFVLMTFLPNCSAHLVKHLPKHWQVSGHKTFVFSPALHQFAAYDKDGYLVVTGVANGGAPHCIGDPHENCATPVGTFKIYRIGTQYCASTEFKGPDGKRAKMPYCMFFYKNGSAIHGSEIISNANTSHGCIRISTKKAAWLWKYFADIGTRVVVLPYSNNQ